MNKMVSRWGMTAIGIWSALIMGLNTGCASGGFKLTRQYASFVNRNNVVLRVILYILTGVVFAVTLLIDAVIFNTMDFWEGRVSQGDYRFEKGGQTYLVHHQTSPSTGLRESKIEILSKANSRQTILISETQTGEIEFRVDGVLRARASDINALPKLSLYDSRGSMTSKRAIWSEEQLVSMN